MTNILQPSASKCTQQWSATYTWCSTLIWVDKGFFTSTHGINPQVRIWNISTFPQNPFFLITSIRPPISAGGVHHSDLHFLELYINGIIHSKTACVWLLFHINFVRIILGVPAVVHSMVVWYYIVWPRQDLLLTFTLPSGRSKILAAPQPGKLISSKPFLTTPAWACFRWHYILLWLIIKSQL